jgi:uncharacterized protein (TIRG00374 family)
MASLFNKLFKVFVPLVVGVVILYFLYRKTDFGAMWLYIQETNWWILSASLIFGLMGNVFRGIRWSLLVHPLGYRPKTSRLIYAVLGSYAVNFVLPRAGELWRCGVVAKNEKIPFAKLIGTILIDRLFDVVMVVLFILAAFVCNIKVFYKNRDFFNLPAWMTAPELFVGLAVVAALCIAVLVFFRNHAGVRKIRHFFVSMGKDMLQVRKMREKTRFILYSFGIWISYFLYFYITFYAFPFTASLGVAAGLFVFTISSISMSIPSNGGLGPWQAAIVFGLCAYLVNIEQARAFATTVFAFQSIWLVSCGLFGIVMLSVGKSVQRSSSVTH